VSVLCGQTARWKRLRPSEIEAIALDRVLVPLNSGAWPVGDQQVAIFKPERLGEDGIGPVLPLEPVSGLSDAHQMGRHLGIEVGRHLDTRRAGDCCCAEPSGDPSDPHQIKHDIIAGPLLDGPEERPRSVKVLAELDGRLKLTRELRVAGEIIVRDGLLEPVKALIVEGMAAVQRVAEAKALVEVDVRLPGAAAIFTAGASGIPLALTHHLRHNRVLHECVLLVSTVSSDEPRVDPDQRAELVQVGAGITRVTLHFGFMEHPNVMEGLKLACRDPDLRGIDPERITFYSRRVMVIPSGKVPGMAVWRERLFAAMHLNANLPAAYFGVPTGQVVEMGLEVEI
jgi:K+ potassium transporter